MARIGPIASTIMHFGARSALDAAHTFRSRRNGLRAGRIHPDDVHLEAAVRWLHRSIAVNGGAGSSHSLVILKNWRPAYPETTGYILKTFLRLAKLRDPGENMRIAHNLGEWLLTVQLPGGGIPGLDLGRLEGANVFNTGMVLLGWNALYRQSGDERYLAAGQKAGDFLLSCLDDKGCFVRATSYGLAHAYNARTAWALLELGQLANRADYLSAAEDNLSWTLQQQTENGYFRNNAFVPGGSALTHSIGYVLSGLVEAYLLTGQERYLASARITAERLQEIYNERGRIVAELDEDFKESSNHICVVGYCQIAIVLLQMWAIENMTRYREVAYLLIDDVKATQWLGNSQAPYHGGIPGSFPIYGRYARLQYPNWAAKFFVDALLLRMQMTRQHSS